MKSKLRKKGFTLVESLFAAMLLGLVIAALAAASGAFTMANGYGLDLSTAEFLIEEVREYTATLPVVDPEDEDSIFGPETDESSMTMYDDIDDFNGSSISPPIDLSGAAMSNFSAYTQEITVENVLPNDFGGAAQTAHSTDFVRVIVTVTKNGTPLNSTSWIRARLN